MKHAMTSLSLSVLLSFAVAGCDNSAKVPTASQKEDTKNTATGTPITIGYSDWPGFVAWQVAIEKGWLKEAGLNVEFIPPSSPPSHDGTNGVPPPGPPYAVEVPISALLSGS